MDIEIMPHLFSFTHGSGNQVDDVHEIGENELPLDACQQRKSSLFGGISAFHKIGSWLKKDGDGDGQVSEEPQDTRSIDGEDIGRSRRSATHNKTHWPVVPEPPRAKTLTRQYSEQRERLTAVDPALERRAQSEDRRIIYRRRQHSPIPWQTLPQLASSEENVPSALAHFHHTVDEEIARPGSSRADRPLTQPPPLAYGEPFTDPGDESEGISERELQEELDNKWILNLSMHFRDKSDREKFFVTYAEDPNRWRRITVSVDYRKAQPESLEADLKTLTFQSDKSKRIYESIRDSLPDIQFYPTVTNLKLETDDGRLHVHVTEDVNEIIQYPSITLVDHIETDTCPRYSESDLDFQSHLSGFVYKVAVNNQILIKKEIPGPDTVDEFLYEINALDALRGSESVIQLHGLVTDTTGQFVKGLLIEYAPGGALVDIMYDHNPEIQPLPLEQRLKWAEEIVTGLADIHEAGFVQGDFTLSNIVIDEHNHAKIIDINRRGCPVGWEPPELERLIQSSQRIGMCIGVKSDIFQLGMVLWALGMHNDEPERANKPLKDIPEDDAPSWYNEIVQTCLSERPQRRQGAKELLRRFEQRPLASYEPETVTSSRQTASNRPQKVYIDPAAAVELADIDHFRTRPAMNEQSPSTSWQVTDGVNPPSTTDYPYQYDSSGSYIVARRRQSRTTISNGASSPYARPVSSDTSVSSLVGVGSHLEGSHENKYAGPSTGNQSVLESANDALIEDMTSLRVDEVTPRPSPAVQYGAGDIPLAAPSMDALHDHSEAQIRSPMHEDSGGLSYDHSRSQTRVPMHQDSGYADLESMLPKAGPSHPSKETASQSLPGLLAHDHDAQDAMTINETTMEDRHEPRLP